MSATTKVEVYDIGLSALRQLLANAGYPDMCDDVSAGDYVVAYGVARFGRCSRVFTISKPMSLQKALTHVLHCEKNDCQAVCMGLCGTFGYAYEIWHVLDDSKELCGEIDESAFEYGECGYSLFCSDEKACREFRDRAEILKVLRQLPDSPILYDVMRYNSKAHHFVCVGANLRYSVAHDMVRRYERGGSVAFLCESVTCHG